MLKFLLVFSALSAHETFFNHRGWQASYEKPVNDNMAKVITIDNLYLKAPPKETVVIYDKIEIENYGENDYETEDCYCQYERPCGEDY